MTVTDKEFLLAVLGDGEPHTLQDLLWRSLTERGHGCTVHSRVADLRRDGHDIRHTTIPGRQRGAASVYRLVGPLSEQREAPAPPAASRSSLNGSAAVPVGDLAVTSDALYAGDLVRAPQQLSLEDSPASTTQRPAWA